MSVATRRMLSPLGRRIAVLDGKPEMFEAGLRRLGWRDYVGPAQASSDLPEPEKAGATLAGIRNGWTIPGMDATVDARGRGHRIGSRDPV